MVKKTKYNIKFINEYVEDELYQFEVESKGCFFGVLVESESISYKLDFYDTTRFKQDIDNELNDTNFIYDYNIIFLRRVTLKNITIAIEELWENNTFDKMIPTKTS